MIMSATKSISNNVCITTHTTPRGDDSKARIAAAGSYTVGWGKLRLPGAQEPLAIMSHAQA